MASRPVEADGDESGCGSPKAGTTNHLGLVSQGDEKWLSEQQTSLVCWISGL